MSLRRPTAALLIYLQLFEESFQTLDQCILFLLPYRMFIFYLHACISDFVYFMADVTIIKYFGVWSPPWYIIPVFLMFASTFKRTHWLVPGYCLGQIPCLEISIAVTTSEPTCWHVQPREDRSYPGQLFLWEMESHRRRCIQPLPPSTTRNEMLYS